MTNLMEIYKCEICGNIVEVLHTGAGELVCCGQPMSLQEEKTQDTGFEKHVPVLEEMDGKTVVKIGENPHPMEEDHFIEWIEILFEDGEANRFFLKPNEKPMIELKQSKKISKIREFCNLHGLWTKSI